MTSNNDYFNKENRLLPHGVMFHHFHREGDRPCGQGSITSSEFQRIIEHIGPENILSANTWLKNAINNKLNKKEICLTFDDALKCQVDIALPILQQFGLTAFWFVYSSVFKGRIEKLEINRYFYNIYFSKFDNFYKVFREYLDKSEYAEIIDKSISDVQVSKYLKEFKLYSKIEREFRFIRDQLLEKEQFQKIMNAIMASYDLNIDEIAKCLWMDDNDLRNLTLNNQKIGLHSFSHPTNLAGMDVQQQQIEYTKNKDHILSVTRQEPETVSHPCGSYNKHTLRILKNIKVKVGFRSNFQKTVHTNLEFPRIDHSYLLKECNVKN